MNLQKVDQFSEFTFVYEIVAPPDYKTIKKITSHKLIEPQVGDIVCVEGVDYEIGRIYCKYDFDTNTKTNSIWLMNKIN